MIDDLVERLRHVVPADDGPVEDVERDYATIEEAASTLERSAEALAWYADDLNCTDPEKARRALGWPEGVSELRCEVCGVVYGRIVGGGTTEIGWCPCPVSSAEKTTDTQLGKPR